MLTYPFLSNTYWTKPGTMLQFVLYIGQFIRYRGCVVQHVGQLPHFSGPIQNSGQNQTDKMSRAVLNLQTFVAFGCLF